MTKSLQELLNDVRAAEPDGAQWAELQRRVLQATTNATLPGACTRPTNAAATVATRPGRWTARIAGGVAAGFVVAGLTLALSQRPRDVASESLRDAAPVLAPTPPAPYLAYPEPHAETWSVQGVAHERRTKSPPSSRAHAAATLVEANRELASAPRELGESDVEYDRRHLAPVDAALRAGNARQALALLEAFEPRKLTSYVNGLRAVALCNAGQLEAGAQLGRRELPKITNPGLSHRVRTACKNLASGSALSRRPK